MKNHENVTIPDWGIFKFENLFIMLPGASLSKKGSGSFYLYLYFHFLFPFVKLYSFCIPFLISFYVLNLVYGKNKKATSHPL